jgi:hypothetical protein
MAILWRWVVAWLVWLSSDPMQIDNERPRAAAAVALAAASLARDSSPAPVPPAPPGPQDCVCGRTCVRGVWKPDGRIEQRCGCNCPRCVSERAKGRPVAAVVDQPAPCPGGKCPPPASPVPARPAAR